MPQLQTQIETIIKNDELGWIAKAGDYDNLNTVIKNICVSEINLELKNRIKENALKKYNLNTQLDMLINRI